MWGRLSIGPPPAVTRQPAGAKLLTDEREQLIAFVGVSRLLTVCAKNQKANLTKAERRELKALVPLLIGNYRKGRQK
jgi:hypothetical protein